MEKLTDNLNIIQNLSNQPTENAQELKSKFDTAGNIIKNFLNEVIIPEIEEIASDYLKNKDLQDFEKDVEDTLGNFQTTLDGLDERITSAVGKATGYGDFTVTTHSIAYSCSQSEGKSLTETYTKDGHKPLGLVGHYYTNIYSATCNGARVTSINDTSIAVQGYVARGNTGGTTAGELILNILWVKVK